MKISCVCFLLLLLLLIAFSQVFFICFALLRRPPSTFMRVLVLVRLRVCVCVCECGFGMAKGFFTIQKLTD